MHIYEIFLGIHTHTYICREIPYKYTSFAKLNNNFGIEFEKNKKEYLEWVGV